MALNHILYRPQVLDRPILPLGKRLPDEAMEMASRLISDFIGRGRATDLAREGMEEAMEIFIAEFKTRIGVTGKSFKALIKPLLDSFEEIAEELGNHEKPSDGFKGVGKLLLLIADILENLSADKLEEFLNNLVKMITVDMGLSKSRMTSLMNDLIDRVVDKLKSDYLGGDKGEEAHNAYLIGAYLDRLRLSAEEHLLELDLQLDIQFIVGRIRGLLSRLDWENIRLKIAYIMEEAGDTANLIGGIMDIFSGSFNAQVSVNVSVNPGPGGPGSANPGPGENCGGFVEDPVSWYATFIERIMGWEVAVGVPDRWKLDTDDTYKDKIAFGEKLDAKTMEEIAWMSDVTADAVEWLLHFASLEKKDISANLTQGLLKLLNVILKGSLGDNNDASWVDFQKVYGHRWMEILVKALISLLTGLESSHDCNGEGQGLFWLTLMGKDFSEGMLYSNWPARLRQGILSILTLVNADPVGKPQSVNHNQTEGLSMLFGELYSWILATFSGRENFGFPAHDGGTFFWVSWWVGGFVSGALAAVTGNLVGWAISHGEQPDGTDSDLTLPSWEAWTMSFVEAIITSWLKHPVYNYLIWNGATDDGKIGQDISENWREDFPGYGDKSTSPYLLPYKKGDIRQCAQNHLGPWSHNPNTKQIYAVDWDHDQDMEVLSVRAGTVSDWHDEYHDHTELSANTLSIAHDLTDPVPGHDRDHLSDAILTTAKYVHGAHFGVRHVFALMGIPEAFITGSIVDQGMLVMLAGDTGMSWYNHLHMHIGTANAKSIPWVFGDSNSEIDGILSDLTWYESDNERVPDPTTFKVGHPEEHKSTRIRNINVDVSAADTITASFSGGWTVGVSLNVGKNSTFPGMILIWRGGGNPDQVRKISGYTWDDPNVDADFTVDVNWNPAPPVGTTLQIWSLARETTGNTIKLDRFANAYNDKYSNRHIHVWWTDALGVTHHEYKWINSYDCGSQIATIDGTWDLQPPSFAEFEIGGRTYSSSDGFYQGFAFISDVGDPTPASTLAQFAYQYGGFTGTIPAAPPSASDTVTLNGPAPSLKAEVTDRFIVITTNNINEQDRRIVAYRKVVDYDPATLLVTVDANWDANFPNGQLRYMIGQVDYAVATEDEAQENAYLCPDSDPNDYTPIDFPNGQAGTPYLSVTYNN